MSRPSGPRTAALVALGFLGLFSFQLLGGLLAGLVAPPVLLHTVLISVSVYATGLVAIALAGARASGEPIGARLRLPPAGLTLGQRYAAVVGLLALGETMTALIALTGLAEHGTLGMLNRLMAHAGPADVLLAAMVLAVLGGTAEELFFRGLIQRALVRWIGRWDGIIATSILFGLIHFDWVQSPAAMLMGLYFGWLTERTGSVRPGIAAHVLNNALAVLLPVLTSMPWPREVYLAELFVAPPIAAAAVWWLHRTLPPQDRVGATAPPATGTR